MMVRSSGWHRRFKPDGSRRFRLFNRYRGASIFDLAEHQGSISEKSIATCIDGLGIQAKIARDGLGLDENGFGTGGVASSG